MKVFTKWKGKTLSTWDQQKIRRNFIPYSVLVAALFAMTFFGVCIPQQGPRGPRGPAAYVGDEEVTFREFRRAYENLRAQRQSESSDGSMPEGEMMAADTLRSLITTRVAFMVARNLGIEASKEEVLNMLHTEAFFHNEEQKFDGERFQNFLNSQGYTQADFLQEVKRQLTNSKLQGLVSGAHFTSSAVEKMRVQLERSEVSIEFLVLDPQKIDVTVYEMEKEKLLASETGRQQVESYYNENIQRYQRQERREIEEILIAYEGARNTLGVTRTKEQAQALAQRLYAQLQQTPQRFSSLVQEYSDASQSADKQHSRRWMSREDMIPELSQAIFALRAQEISDVLVSDFGFHLIKLHSARGALSRSLKEVEGEIAEILLQSSERESVAQQVIFSVLDSMLPDVEGPSGLETEDSVQDQNQNTDGTGTDTAEKYEEGGKREHDENAEGGGSGASQASSEKEKKMTFEDIVREYGVEWKALPPFSILARDIPEIGTHSELSRAILLHIPLYQSQNEPSLIPTPFQVSGKWYLVRVRGFTPAPEPQAGEYPSQSTSPWASVQGYLFYQSLIQSYIQQLDKQNLIKRNPDYLALDAASQSS